MAAALKRLPCVWQHPFVDVFKTFSVDSAERRGDVAEKLDRELRGRVFRVRGSVSANNFLLLPGPAHSLRTLGLTGEYVYLQVKALEMKHFLVHLDLTVASSDTSLRITLSNMYTQVKTMHNKVQCPCPVQARWTVVSVHIPTVLTLNTALPPHSFILKAVQICASLYVRNVYTSDIRFTNTSLPREMLFDHQVAVGEHYGWLDIPGGEVAERGRSLHSGICDVAARSGFDALVPLDPPFERNTQERNFQERNTREGTGGPAAGLGSLKPPLLPDPFLQVQHLVGVAPRTRRIPGLAEAIPRTRAVFLASGRGRLGGSCRVLFASSMTLTLVDPATRLEQCFFGHSQRVELLEVSGDSLWVASVQGSEGGAPPLLRLWQHDGASLHCTSVLSCPALASVRAAAFGTGARSLVLAGADLQGRQQLLVWDISRLEGGGDVSLLARQISADWDIDCVKFSPFEEQHLVTCGRESIRFWRVKDGHLPGCSVVLNALARQSHFTCVAFELTKSTEQARMFVGTAKGKVLQLSYKDRKVQAVHQLHTEAITSLCASEGFLTSASADKFVRVWPLDFSSYYLQAVHESPVASADITHDGLDVLCSTVDGSVGVLNMQTQSYVSLVRSHGAPISDAAVSLVFQELATVSRDGTLKLWDLTSMVQKHTFETKDDAPLVVAFHPADRHIIAVGFQSGAMRVFDVDGSALLHENRHHSEAMVSVVFVPQGLVDGTCSAQVVTCDRGGALVVHQESKNFQPMSIPEWRAGAAPPEHCNAIACALPWLLQYLDQQSAGILSFPELEQVQRLRVPSSAISTLAFSLRASFALLGCADSKLYVYEVATGCLAATHCLAGGRVSAVALAEPSQGLAVLLAATEDTRLRVWQLDVSSATGAEQGRRCQRPPRASSLQAQPLEQCFIGHATAPHRVLVTPLWVVSVSSSEVISWATSGDYFERHFAEEWHQKSEAQTGVAVASSSQQKPAPAAGLVARVVEQVPDAKTRQGVIPAQQQPPVPSPPKEEARRRSIEATPTQQQQPPVASPPKEEARRHSMEATPTQQQQRPVASPPKEERPAAAAVAARSVSPADGSTKALVEPARSSSVSTKPLEERPAAAAVATRNTDGSTKTLVEPARSSSPNVEAPPVAAAAGAATKPPLERLAAVAAAVAGSRSPMDANARPAPERPAAAAADAGSRSPVDVNARLPAERPTAAAAVAGSRTAVDASAKPPPERPAVAAVVAGSCSHVDANAKLPLERPATAAVAAGPKASVNPANIATDAGAAVAKPPAEPPPQDRGEPPAPGQAEDDEVAERPLVQLRPRSEQVARGDALKLLGVAGCATMSGSQNFAWQASSGFLCHTVGCIVHVEQLRSSSSPRDERASGALDSGGSVLTGLPGVESFALDMEPSEGVLLAILSADGPVAGGQVWLSLCCLQAMGKKCSGQLPASYSVHPKVAAKTADGEAADGAQLARAWPMIRLLAGGAEAVTATASSDSGSARVDIWRFDGDRCSLQCSAEPPFAPLGLLPLGGDAGEFLTLSFRMVVFWQRTGEKKGVIPTGGSASLQLLFQVTEEPLATPEARIEDEFEFTSFCLVQLRDWQLLLVGTTHGRVWAYNADDNLALAELCVVEGKAIQSLACAQWPTLLCGTGDQICAFTLAQGEQVLQVGGSAEPLRLDGQVQSMVLSGSLPQEGVACTEANSLWYFDMGRGSKIPLQSFHAAPSRVVRSNSRALEAAQHGSHGGPSRSPEIIATCADDGRVCVWSCEAHHSQIQAVADITANSACTAMAFPCPSLLACSFASGHVCVFNVCDLSVACQFDVGRGDPVLALEAVSRGALVAGTLSGKLVQLELPPSITGESAGVCTPQSEAPAEASCALGLRPLQGPQRGGAVCRLERDHETEPIRLLACFTVLELWVWECTGGRRLRHTCTWVWPESKPKPWSQGGCSTEASCLELLSSPPVVASFVMMEGCSVVAVTAPPAPCVYLYSCVQGTVVNRVQLGPQLPRVLRLWSPPPHYPAQAVYADRRRSGLLLLLCRDRFVRLRLHTGGTRTTWLEEEPLQLPGSVAAAARRCSNSRAGGTLPSGPPRGTPDACLLASKAGRQRILLKGDAGISAWEMA